MSHYIHNDSPHMSRRPSLKLTPSSLWTQQVVVDESLSVWRENHLSILNTTMNNTHNNNNNDDDDDIRQDHGYNIMKMPNHHHHDDDGDDDSTMPRMMIPRPYLRPRDWPYRETSCVEEEEEDANVYPPSMPMLNTNDSDDDDDDDDVSSASPTVHLTLRRSPAWSEDSLVLPEGNHNHHPARTSSTSTTVRTFGRAESMGIDQFSCSHNNNNNNNNNNTLEDSPTSTTWVYWEEQVEDEPLGFHSRYSFEPRES